MTAPAQRCPDPQVLSRVVTDPHALLAADVPHVLAAGLGGAVRAQLPEVHPLRGALRPQMLDLALRHGHIKAEMQPLLVAWAQAGIPTLMFKGFALAEFEYPTKGERFYGDVDVLLPPDLETVMRAANIAIAHDWRSDGQHADPSLWTHETMHLYSPGGHVRIDVHRYVVALMAGLSESRACEITAGVWRRAQPFHWDGIEILRPHPLDAVVVNVALGRCWGGDSGGLKPADYLDVQLLMRRYALKPDDLKKHAEQLRANQTWTAFMQVCDPARKMLNLDMQETQPSIHAAIEQDSLRYSAGRWKDRASLLRRIWPVLPGALLDVLAAWWVVRQGGDPREHLRRWTPQRLVRRLPLRALNSRILAVSWWTRLLYPKQRRLGVCVPRAYATYRALRRLGHPVVFISGVARSGGTMTGHAWVEDDHGSLELYGEPNNRQVFKTVFTFPDSES